MEKNGSNNYGPQVEKLWKKMAITMDKIWMEATMVKKRKNTWNKIEISMEHKLQIYAEKTETTMEKWNTNEKIWRKDGNNYGQKNEKLWKQMEQLWNTNE